LKYDVVVSWYGRMGEKKWKNAGEGDTIAFGCGRIAVAYAWHNG